MRAQFDINAEFRVVVETLPGNGVEIRSMTGVDYEGNLETSDKIKRNSIVLGKSEARAIASALMGCAAEL